MSRSICCKLPELLFCLLLGYCAPVLWAQTTTFTYQGRLAVAGNPANGDYDLQFKLFDTPNVGTGTQQGLTLIRTPVLVSAGAFSVMLDFGANVFDGMARYLEIGVRPQGSADPYTLLNPRQAITSTPYAIRSLTAANATQLGGVAASGFIQNTTTPQTADFNISGNGSIGGNLTVSGTLSLNIVNAQTQFNLGGQRILKADNGNLLVGQNTGTAGAFNTFVGHFTGVSSTGCCNTFLGAQTGQNNTTGSSNVLLGGSAGLANTSGSRNTYVGEYAGRNGNAGNDNAFFGWSAGFNNTAINNAFFGSFAGEKNTTATNNSFFGTAAGQSTTLGGRNSFFGAFAGNTNVEGDLNAFFGYQAGFNNKVSHNSFFGYQAGRSNTTGVFNSFFGRLTGGANTTGSLNAFFGVGAGENNTTGSSNTFIGTNAGTSNTTASDNSFFGREAGLLNQTGTNNAFFGRSAGRANINNENAYFGALAGQSNTTGDGNSFFGFGAGSESTAGYHNGFFGWYAGNKNTSGFHNNFFGGFAGGATTEGSYNSFFGDLAGVNNTTGNGNTFFGAYTGYAGNPVPAITTPGSNNTFIGVSAGRTNTTGNANTLIGAGADVGAANLSNATAIGAGALVNASNTLVLGRSADTVQIPGNLNLAGNLTGGNIVKNLNGLTGNVTLAAGANVTLTPAGNTLTIAATGGGGASLTVKEVDGTPTVANVSEIRVSNGTLVNNGSGAVSITTGSVNAILNQTTPQTGANFNIDGNGTVGGTLTANNVQAAGSGFVLGNFGIGTAAPKAKLDVTGGNILIDSPGKGVILKSPDGNTCRLLRIDDAGAFTLTAIACP